MSLPAFYPLSTYGYPRSGGFTRRGRDRMESSGAGGKRDKSWMEMSARKTWSDNTIDERSIAFSSSHPNESTQHAHAQRVYPLFVPLCPVTQHLSFPPPFSPVLFLLAYHGLLSPSYPYVTLTYRVVGLRSTCILLYKEFKLSINFHRLANRDWCEKRAFQRTWNLDTGRTKARSSPLRLILRAFSFENFF